eukprot:7270030-Lingulodinium_polyedra.AAC.1
MSEGASSNSPDNGTTPSTWALSQNASPETASGLELSDGNTTEDKPTMPSDPADDRRINVQIGAQPRVHGARLRCVAPRQGGRRGH